MTKSPDIRLEICYGWCVDYGQLLLSFLFYLRWCKMVSWTNPFYRHVRSRSMLGRPGRPKPSHLHLAAGSCESSQLAVLHHRLADPLGAWDEKRGMATPPPRISSRFFHGISKGSSGWTWDEHDEHDDLGWTRALYLHISPNITSRAGKKKLCLSALPFKFFALSTHLGMDWNSRCKGSQILVMSSNHPILNPPFLVPNSNCPCKYQILVVESQFKCWCLTVKPC